MAKLYLGVDGGQSGTKALIGDESGRILGAGEGGPCNHAGAAEGAPKLTRAVTEAVGGACRAVGLDPAAVAFESACFGMSGGPDDKEALLRRAVRASRWVITHDAAIALAGAAAGEPGVIVIAGTGSIAFGRNAADRTARAGGWGYVFGDEGGAFDIVRQALRAALRFEEGWGPATILRERLLEATGSRDANDALHRFYTVDWPRNRVAALAPMVDEAADAGDEAASAILAVAAQQLATLAGSVRGQLWRDGEPALVSHTGGVFRSPRVLARFKLLVEMQSGNRCAAPAHDPASGALLEAYRAAGLRPALTR
jgi:N-acetylglucosamine kinase-like BadF-type ATPase